MQLKRAVLCVLVLGFCGCDSDVQQHGAAAPDASVAAGAPAADAPIADAAPPVALTRVDPEPYGANCPGGGDAVRVGVDTNGDGILEDSEIQSTTYVCTPNFIAGDVVIHDWPDLDQLAGIAVVTGDLVVDSPTVDALDLPDLRVVGGDVACGSPGNLPCLLVSAQLPNLTSVQNMGFTGASLQTLNLDNLATTFSVGFDDVSITSLVLPALMTAHLSVFGAPQLTAISIPTLQTGAVDIQSVPLATLTMPAFLDGDLSVQACAGLTSIAAPVLAHGSVTISNLTALKTLDLPALADVSELSVVAVSALPSLSLPALTSVLNVDLDSNTALTSVAVPELAMSSMAGQPGALTVMNNPLFSNCAALTLWKQMGYPTIDLASNGRPATCSSF